MSLEKEIIQLLERYRDTQYEGNASKAARSLGVTPATFSRWISGKHLPKVESLIEPFKKLNASIVIEPSDIGTSNNCKECMELKEKMRDMEISFSKKLLEAKDEIIKLQKELYTETQKNDLQQLQRDMEKRPEGISIDLT